MHKPQKPSSGLEPMGGIRVKPMLGHRVKQLVLYEGITIRDLKLLYTV